MKWCNDMTLGKKAEHGMKRAAGFTLIELMIGVAIVAILAAIAIPSYTAYIVRGKRAEAKTALLQAAQALERNYSVAGCYNFTDQASCAAAGGGVAPAVTSVTPSGAYWVHPLAGALLASSFTLAATPCAGGLAACAAGANFVDADCGELQLDNIGSKTALAGAAAVGTAVATTCWQH